MATKFIASNKCIIESPVEATAIGNILTQAIALGYLNSWDEAQLVVKNSFETILYEPNNQSNWDESYNKLLELIK